MPSKEKFASALSWVVSPITAVPAISIALYFRYIPKTLVDTLKWFSVTFGLIIVFVAILLAFIKYKIVSNWDVTRREQRPKLFVILFVLLALNVVFSYIFGYKEVTPMVALSAIAFGVAFLITFYWKISIHTFATTLAVGMLIYLFKSPWLGLLFALPLATAWSRVYLQRHTLSQATGGIMLAIWIFTLWVVISADVSAFV